MPSWLIVFAGIVSVQLGAGLAGSSFSRVTPAGLTGLRLWWSALIMTIVGGRGLAQAVREIAVQRAWRDAGVAVAFGVALGLMNFSIYQSFARIPLGVAVTIEFLGPLFIAVASSRRLVDLLWVALAGGGVLLLTRGHLQLDRPGAGHGAELTGVIFALVAAACWAAYILLSRATGRRFGGSAGLVIAMLVAAVVVTPAAVVSAGGSLLRPDVLGTGLVVGLLSSVIPYRLELEALRRVPPRLFGVWMSLEPAVAALVGLVILGESLAARQWLAIGLVIIACAGAARSGGRATAAPDDLPPPPGG